VITPRRLPCERSGAYTAAPGSLAGSDCWTPSQPGLNCRNLMREKRQHSLCALAHRAGAVLIRRALQGGPWPAWARCRYSRGHTAMARARHLESRSARAVAVPETAMTAISGRSGSDMPFCALRKRAALKLHRSPEGGLGLTALRPIQGEWTDQRTVSQGCSQRLQVALPLSPRPLQGSMNTSRSRNPGH